MSDLTDFLLARTAEDEAAARKAIEGSAPAAPDFSIDGWPDVEWPGRVVLVGPERFLVECEAKRRIVDLHVPVPGRSRCPECGGTDYPVDFPCPTLRHLAMPYADHADYRDEWRP